MLVQKLLGIAQVGGSAVLYVLLALSVLSIGIIIERAWWFSRRKVDAHGLADHILKLLGNGEVDAAKKLCSASRSVEAAIIGEGLEWYDRGPDALKEILDKGIREHRKDTEGGLVFLGTLGNNAPFVGLFGTVLGIVTAFKELSATTAGGGGAGGMNNVMGGIAEALVATAIGILVAIPAVVAYNVFSKKAADVEENVGALGNAVVAQLRGEMHAVEVPLARAARNGKNELRAVPVNNGSGGAAVAKASAEAEA